MSTTTDNANNDADENNDDTSYFGHSNWHTLVIVLISLSLILRNPKVRYYFNYSFFTFMVMVTCIVNTPLLLLRPKNPANMLVVYPFAWLTALVVDMKFELRGAEILRKEQAAVLAVNHQSSFDVLAHCCVMNVVRKCVIVSRIELFYLLPYGIFMTLAGSIFVNRSDGKSANENLLKTTPVLARHKAKLLIYPEGKRRLNCEVLNPFKKGAFRVAIDGQFPIIPMIISPFYFIDAKKKHFRPGKVILKVLDPISTVGFTLDDIDVLVNKTWNIMNDEYQILRKEVKCFAD